MFMSSIPQSYFPLARTARRKRQAIVVSMVHLAPFSQAARKVGLADPPTTTVVGQILRPLLQAYVAQVWPYPHAAIVPQVRGKVGSRLRLYKCTCQPPVKVRVARDDFQARCLTCGAVFVQAQAGK